ncbi:MAG: hypothetical protein PWP64_1382 [Candidatus Cloacimonadota bacterium]|nr:hypothetical protein [Candidatus Cloacimonadota bacterium]
MSCLCLNLGQITAPVINAFCPRYPFDNNTILRLQRMEEQ